ncbi:serine/threonine protein kinase [Gluconacetobacter sp. 1b LMG 1731]|uniref:Serine/threonine protein kinase n=1 Tax=Gluconacetobacter dulcium TaxID=2729096 RepID=A0A7W4ING5_9PROT|nr:serine/threonine-protein kinase [Gluconacetobacter dulcium]MBB2166160.1 serine/threonine protein kinase [Gluconacetobacter dulcium]MBB2195295.1 serine/threonine protein kinase [Gluconacetobacter dulcium]
MKLPPRYEKVGSSFCGGGMSTAFKCKDKHLDRHVLVKVLQPGVDQKRILDEVKALSAIRSKHVVQIYDVLKDSSGAVTALVEEFLPGQDMNAVIPIKDVDTFLRYVYAIACGLADIHVVGVVHRDIKPNNMKIDAEGCLRIFDFGLSRTDGVNCETIGTIGTLGYIAPELCAPPNQKVNFTTAVDVFAFGATALKLVRGKLPNNLRTIPPSLPSADADFTSQTLTLPPEIAAILNQCLSKKAARRPSMETVRDTVGRHLLHGRHKATMIVGEKIHYLEKIGQSVKLSAGSLGSVNVSYNGYNFIATNVVGDVFINNMNIVPPQNLPGACVITLGAPSLGVRRRYITFDVTHPEVVL